MKVSELIDLLQSQDPNADVHVSYNYGDHWRTQVAPRARWVEEMPIAYSEYHRMDKVADEDCYDEETGELVEGARTVVVIG